MCLMRFQNRITYLISLIRCKSLYKSLVGYIQSKQNKFSSSFSWRVQKENINNGRRWIIKEKNGGLQGNSNSSKGFQNHVPHFKKSKDLCSLEESGRNKLKVKAQHWHYTQDTLNEK